MTPSIATVAALSLALTGGCTAIFSTVKVVQAQQAVADLQTRGALELAPYEYTLARRYAQKAIEESGDAEHRTAVDLAKISLVWKAAAERKMSGGGRDLGELNKPAADPLMEDEGAPGTTTPPRRDPDPEPERDTDEDFFDDDDDEEAP